MPEPIAVSHLPVSAPERDELPSAWEHCRPELARLVAALGVPRGSIDDVLQDVCLVVLEKPPPVANREELRRWLFRVTVNRANLEHRRCGRWRAALETLARGLSVFGRESNPAQAAEDADEQEIVRRALERLEPTERNILVLRYYAEMNSREIAQILDVPDSTVRSRLRLARGRLADALKRAGYRHD